MKTIFTLLSLIFISSFNLYAQEQKHLHTAHLDTLVEHYLSLKNALVADNFENSKLHIAEFATEVRSNSEMNIHDEHAATHQNHHGMMIKAITMAENATSIKELRAAFVAVSKELLTALENQDYKHPSLFVQFCPMANEGKGAKWISEEEKIANPYYGQRMLSCGETVSKIE